MGFAIALAAVAALLLLRVGVGVTHIPGALTVRVTVGFVSFTVFRRPSGRKKPRARRGEGRRGKGGAGGAGKNRPPRSPREVLEAAARLLGKLRRRVLIKRLYVRYVHGGGGGAFSAAMAFGGISAALGLASGTLESAARVKRYDMSESVDFLVCEPEIYIDAAASLAVWEIISLAVSALILFSRSSKT
ncbi:MAG: hypothetical protein LBD49_02595 [Oscillospiraceae bacterium]|jgi:hypothetical protein|nr:hypothetical protein [Oscillospiraceae bacterium]